MLQSAFDDCDIPDVDLGGKTNGWILGIGPLKLILRILLVKF